MTIRITGEWEGVREFDRAFLKVESHLSDFRPVWDDVAEEWWYPLMLDQFQSDGAAGGAPWKPLSDSYAEWKRLHTSWGSLVDVSLLRLTDDMYKSLTRRGAKDNIDRRDKLSAEFGTVDRKARRHQEGGGRLPARVIIPNPMPALLLKKLQKTLQKSLVREMRDTGLVQRTLEL